MSSTLAQQSFPETEAIVNENISSYLKSVSLHAVIYSGKVEARYTVGAVNYPYLDTDEFRTGILSFDGRVYSDVLIRLNQHLEELSVMSPGKNFSVMVPKNRIDYAIIDSLLIVHHQPESADGIYMPEGFYIRLYNGENQVWKRDVYNLDMRQNHLYWENFFNKKTKIYVLKDGKYNPVKNKKTLLNIFSDKKKELNIMIKEHDIDFRANLEKAIVTVTNYYDELNK